MTASDGYGLTFFLGEPSPYAALLVSFYGPLEAGPFYRAWLADLLGSLDLVERGPGASDREEDVRIGYFPTIGSLSPVAFGRYARL